MIELSRSLVRQFRGVVRQSLPPRSLRAMQPPTVVIETNGTELRLRVHLGEVAIEYRQPVSQTSYAVAVPLTALDDFEGRSEEKVTLESVGADIVRASWHEGVMPRVREYAPKDAGKPPKFLALPARFTQMPLRFLQALDDARLSAAKESPRYALTRLQLRGAKGEIVGTDGKELLILSGFKLPWQEDVLIPALPVFGCRELSQADTIQVGKTASHVCLRTDHWTVHLAIDRDGRYPAIESVIPRPSGGGTRWRLDATDASFLTAALKRLPTSKADGVAVTVDLNGEAVVRSRCEQGRVTEMVLPRSKVSGPPVRVASNVRHLQRALQLGLADFYVGKPEATVLVQGEQRRFVWMPLSKESVLSPSPDAVCIMPPGEEASVVRRKREMRAARPPVGEPTPVPEQPIVPVAQGAGPTGTPWSVWDVLRGLFAPRGWLMQARKAQRS